ncbi:MAG: HAMP domain-containing sensor histidine kinase [Ferruginibacter sp.]
MQNKTKKIQLIYIIYWSMLAYTIAALVFWFVSLYGQNELMNDLKMKALDKNSVDYTVNFSKLKVEKKRKTAQYIGEGVTFFLVILAGAIYIFRSVRRQLKQSLQQQNFMIAITHELKTPIAVAQLNLETLQKRKLEESQQQRLIRNTLQETVRLNALCNNMLLSSQIDAGGYRMTNEEINISLLIENCVHEFKMRFPDKPLLLSCDADIFVFGDELLLQMAVNNLLDNAIKYSPKASPVTVTLNQKEDILFTVSDEGNGIKDDDKKKVFEKFYRAGNTATKKAKGTGLGLYLTSKIVKAHHGTISIKDHLPAGTVFAVLLKSA